MDQPARIRDMSNLWWLENSLRDPVSIAEWSSSDVEVKSRSRCSRQHKPQLRFTALREDNLAAFRIVAAISRRNAALTVPIGSVETRS